MARNNGNYTILWLSRHPMTNEQKAYWLGISPAVHIVTENVTWQATEDANADMTANADTWKRLVRQYNPAVILGVFPPVAMEAITHKIQMYSPVSIQDKTQRQDGTAQIAFRHARWSGQLNPLFKWNASCYRAGYPHG